MDVNVVMKTWIENKITELEESLAECEIEREWRATQNKVLFPNMEISTTEWQWKAQLAVLRELQEFGNTIPGK